MGTWNFLTNHGLVLTYIDACSDCTGVAIAQAVGITERATRKIMADLEAEGYIERKKVGRLNQYRINTSLPFWRRGEQGVTVGELLELLWRDRD
jgi:predicted ArsR family transcriptional regulator